MTEKEYDYIRDNYFEDWYQNGGCDSDDEELFWYGYETCMKINGLTKYVKDLEE